MTEIDQEIAARKYYESEITSLRNQLAEKEKECADLTNSNAWLKLTLNQLKKSQLTSAQEEGRGIGAAEMLGWILDMGINTNDDFQVLEKAFLDWRNSKPKDIA